MSSSIFDPTPLAMNYGSVEAAALISTLSSFQIEKPRVLSVIESGNRNDNFAVEDAAAEERCALLIMAPLVMARDSAYYRLIAADDGDPVDFLTEKVRIMRSRLEQRRDLARVLRV